MQYLSTRGGAKINFSNATLSGLASDGGLYSPAIWPHFDEKQLRNWRGLSYTQLATHILGEFVGDAIAPATLSEIVKRAYKKFPADPAPLVELDDNLYLLELFHGPTFAFKDFALQLLAQIFEILLKQRDMRCTIIGATSGDTGSAAIMAMRALTNIDLYMLHPAGRISDIQRKQMTCITDTNIHNLAVAGDFDACQKLVKNLFSDTELNSSHNLAAVNSINWTRIAAQVVYYFYAWLKLDAPTQINFSVPSGNFGNAFAGYVAHKLGLPIAKLIIGSNKNDILTRFFNTANMQKKPTATSISPSMDIQVSSNVERYLFELYERDSERVQVMMDAFTRNGEFKIDQDAHRHAREFFAAYKFSDAQTRAQINFTYKKNNLMLDPHSAIGVAAARAADKNHYPTVAMATAHPAKFGDAVTAACGTPPQLPDGLKKIMHADEKMIEIADDLSAVKQLIIRG